MGKFPEFAGRWGVIKNGFRLGDQDFIFRHGTRYPNPRYIGWTWGKLDDLPEQEQILLYAPPLNRNIAEKCFLVRMKQLNEQRKGKTITLYANPERHKYSKAAKLLLQNEKPIEWFRGYFQGLLRDSDSLR